MPPSPRAFVLRHTRLRPVPGLEEIRLHLVDDVLTLWRAVHEESGDPEAPLPYWAIAWGGGLAIGRHLREHPGIVAGRRVLDLAAGSGLCGFAAALAGAASVTCADIDPHACAAIACNARANGVTVRIVCRDLLAGEPPDIDVILAGDCCYEGALASRVIPWLRRAEERGIEVIVGDPGRIHLPAEELVQVALYDVRTTSDLEDLQRRQGRVYRLRDAPGAGRERAAG
jgi:predicted nicotinamide N-methyase